MSVPRPDRLEAAPRRSPGGRAPQHLQLVEPRPRRQLRWRPRGGVVAAVAGAVLVVFGVVALHAVLAQRQFALDRLTQQVSQEQTRYQNLRLQVAQLGAPARIISIAEGKLGMREPTSVTYLTSPGGTAPAPSRTPLGFSAQPGAKQPPTGTAPSGDANWPAMKALMAGTP